MAELLHSTPAPLKRKRRVGNEYWRRRDQEDAKKIYDEEDITFNDISDKKMEGWGEGKVVFESSAP